MGSKLTSKVNPEITITLIFLINQMKTRIISEEIAKLLQKEVITECKREQRDFLSNVFTRKKKDGNMSTTLKLKYLNKHVTYNHFKMESLQDESKIVQPHCSGQV